MDVSALKQLASHLHDSLCGKRLTRFVQYDVNVFTCKVDNRSSLVFAPVHGDPRVYYGDTLLEGASLSSTLGSILRKSFGNATVRAVSVLNDDRILRFDLTIINEVFKQEEAAIIIELVPNHPNLILLNQEGKIVYALKMTTLDDRHPIVKGLLYQPPEKVSVKSSAGSSFCYEDYLSSCLEKEKAILETKKKRRYSTLFTRAKNLKKSANRKYLLIENDVSKAKEHLGDADLGTMLLTYAADLDCSSGEVDIDGFKIEVDPNLSVYKNAENYFKKYKKAKATIARGEENLERARKEIEEAKSLEFALSFGDEEILDELLESKNSKHKGKAIQPSAFLPYETTFSGVRVLLGKNAVQNDFLTFHYTTNKEYYWFHAKDTPGAHVILECEEPSSNLLQLCCEMALLGSNLKSGEVQYCKRVQLRKGKVKGQVILGSYQSAFIRSISSETKKAFEGLERIKLK